MVARFDKDGNLWIPFDPIGGAVDEWVLPLVRHIEVHGSQLNLTEYVKRITAKHPGNVYQKMNFGGDLT